MRDLSYRAVLLASASALMAGASAACSGTEPASDDGLTVFVSILPQQYFVDRIGGDHVAVNVMVGPGANPATYEPKPEQLRALSGAEAYFTIGVPFEDVWLDRIAAANPDMVVVDTIAGIERMPMAAHDLHDDEQAADGSDGGDEANAAAASDGDVTEEHAAGAPDPHVWLSPELVKLQAQTIHDALVELDPDHADDYSTNRAAFIADVDQLEADIREMLSDRQSDRFIVFHPSWGYFARDFGLTQVPIQVGGQEPSAQELAAVIAEAREAGIHVILAQPEFSAQDAETIAGEIDGEVLLVSPLAADWLDNMRRMADTFAEVLGRDE